MRTPTVLYLISPLIMLFVLSCSHNPRWTPGSVQPPEHLERAIAAADELARSGRDSLATADRPTTLPLSRDGAILTAIARNRSLAVERYNPLIAETLAGEARAAFDPTLLSTISYGRRIEQLRGSRFATGEGGTNDSREVDGTITLSNEFPTGTDVFLTGGMSRATDDFTDPEYFGSWSLGVTQSLLRGVGTAVNLVELRQARLQTAATHHQLRDFVIELVRQTEFAYWEVVLAVERIRIREFSVELAEEQLRLNQSFLDVGMGVQADVVSAEAEVASRRADLVDARAELRQATIEVVRLMNPDEPHLFSVAFDAQDSADAVELQLDPEAATVLARLYRPDLAQARLDLASRDLEIIRTSNGLLPRLDAFASYGHTSLGSDFQGGYENLPRTEYPNYRVGLELEWQPVNREARARHRRANFEQARAETAIANLEQLIDAQIYRLASEVQRQWERIQATEEAVRSREVELTAARSRFEVGFLTTLDVLRVQESLVEAQLAFATAKVRYIQSLTDYFAAEGTLLDRRGIALEAAAELR